MQQLANGDVCRFGFDENEFLIGPTLLPVRLRDALERRRTLDGDAVRVFVDRPPKLLGLQNDESVKQISENRKKFLGSVKTG